MKTALLLVLVASPAVAVELSSPFPAQQTYLETQPLGSHAFAVGPFNESLPVEVVEGAITRRVLQLEAPGKTSLEMLAPLRDSLEAAGWTAGYTCETAACGAFDFRFAYDVTPAPEMFVDLADFRYLELGRDDERVDILVSPSGAFGYVQITHVGPAGSLDAVAVSSSNAAQPRPGLTGDSISPSAVTLSGSTTGIASALRQTGRAVLTDLVFPTGSTDLPEDSYASLAELAEYLRSNTDATIALVGHTDAEGSAAGNMAVSERRAASARAILTGTHGIDPARIATFGVGFFAPIASNAEELGRAANRRVEVVLTSTPGN